MNNPLIKNLVIITKFHFNKEAKIFSKDVNLTSVKL